MIERNILKKLFHKGRQINTTTDALLPVKKTYTAKIGHLSASAYSDSSTPWFEWGNFAIFLLDLSLTQESGK